MWLDGFLPETAKIVVGTLAIGILGLSWLSRRRPDVEWLRPFRLPDRRSEEQKQRARRMADITAGIQFILLGIVIPPGYLILEMMFFFSETTALEMLLAGAAGLVCIGIGIMAIVRARSSAR